MSNFSFSEYKKYKITINGHSIIANSQEANNALETFQSQRASRIEINGYADAVGSRKNAVLIAPVDSSTLTIEEF